MSKYIFILVLTILLFGNIQSKPIQENKFNSQVISMNVDNDTYITTDLILMFVTNHGNFGRDLSGVFGYDYGTWFPFTTINEIINNIDNRGKKSPLFAAGIWLGGIIDGEIRVSTSEYESEFVPGPMKDGTYQTDKPEFKVYKLYSDSLSENPNSDYLNWPIDQGAPIYSDSTPKLLGEKMTWSVYNDADLNQHINFGSTPMGVEIQQTNWVNHPNILDTLIMRPPYLIIQDTSDQLNVIIEIKDAELISLNQYMVYPKDTIVVYEDTIPESGNPVGKIITDSSFFVWNLKDITTGIDLLENQIPGKKVITDLGFSIIVTSKLSSTRLFTVTSNGSGDLSEPVAGALAFADFPTPNNTDPDETQQVGNGKWAIHTADNGGTLDGGDRSFYVNFLERVLRNDNVEDTYSNNYQFIFNGSYENPGVNGSYASRMYQDEDTIWVPFEIWCSPNTTPNDASDDYRMSIWLYDVSDDRTFNLENWGSSSLGGGGLEHSVSGSDDDPYTDWIYVMRPADTSAGESGYLADLDKMMNGTYTYSDGYEVLARLVFVNWNGGSAPPFNQDLPEVGTIFNFGTNLFNNPTDSLYFHFENNPEFDSTIVSPEDFTIYFKYKIYNKGSNYISDMYFSIWADADIGSSGDDFTGSDSVNNIFFCYNGGVTDAIYGINPPALGFKILQGPIVPATGQTAYFDNYPIINHTNLGLTSVINYNNSFDPDTPEQLYNNMMGRDAISGNYLIDPTNGMPTTYMVSGDPVTGTGWLDQSPADRRVVGSCGPFDMNPGDSQFVLIKMSVGMGFNRLESVKYLKDNLNYNDISCCKGIRGNINNDIQDLIDISDLLHLVDYLYASPFGPAPECFEEGDLNNDNSIDVSDLILLVDYMFNPGSAAPAYCE